MEDKLLYPQTDNDDRYEGGEQEQYEYTTNASGNDRDEDLNFEDYTEAEDNFLDYPIGDGQDIDETGAVRAGGGGGGGGSGGGAGATRYISGDCQCGDDYEYVEYRPARVYHLPQPRNINIRGLMSNKSKYPVTYATNKRSQVFPQRSSVFYPQEMGDYRRLSILERLNLIKREQQDEYPSTGVDPSLYKTKRSKILHGLSEGDYCTNLQKLQQAQQVKGQNIKRPPTTAAGGTVPSTSFAPHDKISLTHDQLQEAFIKNYKMELRNPLLKPAKVESFDVQPTRNPRIPTSPHSDTAALREYYNAAKNRILAQRMERHETKDTKSEPNQQNYEQNSSKYSKSPSQKSNNSRTSSSKCKKPITIPTAIPKIVNNYNAMMKAAAQKSSKRSGADVEVKYKNEDFGVQDDVDNGAQDNGAYPVDTDTSDEKVSSPYKDSTRMASSPHSHRSKKKSPSLRNRQYSDMVKLQKSKCTVYSVIYDGIQKCEQSNYEYSPKYKYDTKTSDDSKNTLKASKHSQTITSSSEVLSSDIMSNIVKDFRDYHYQNIFREVKRLQDLDILPKKIRKQLDSN